MQTPTQLGHAEQTIQKSRFIAQAKACETERHVATFLRQLASQHPSAHHLAYAYRIKTATGILPRFSDAGEPSGTAGKPILQMLDGQNIVNIGVGVIRYYGGINLGTGGLVKAYGGTAKLAIEASGLAPYVAMQSIRITTHYKRVDELTRAVQKLNGEVLDKVFDTEVHFAIRLPADAVAKIVQQFKTDYPI